VADIERAFAQAWATTGLPLPLSELPRREDVPPAGTVSLRVIASEPSTAGLYRLDTLVAAGAQRSLWLTDAYFVGTTVYIQALVAAAKDGVDVRLLVPGASDLVLIRALSRAGYRPLLEGGVRVFEWNGSMLHAKTAVADGRWARVGSSNLNPSSWLGNWELDIAVEDEGFAHAMEDMFLNDLEQATEIVLSAQDRGACAGREAPVAQWLAPSASAMP
jgi:cardiolipin synthase